LDQGHLGIHKQCCVHAKFAADSCIAQDYPALVAPEKQNAQLRFVSARAAKACAPSKVNSVAFHRMDASPPPTRLEQHRVRSRYSCRNAYLVNTVAGRVLFGDLMAFRIAVKEQCILKNFETKSVSSEQ
jgi:hypothetical protein